MVNTTIFGRGKSASISKLPAADTVNNAGGIAYKLSDKQALAQLACTNTFNGTFYASAEDNYKLAKEYADKLKEDPEFIAKVAVYARDRGYMKDMPAYLCAVLAELDTDLFKRVFRRVIDNGKMLRNVIQIARSGGAGRVRNMSSGAYRTAIQEWFNKRSPYAIFRASVGNDPSMKDMLRMVRPKPNTKEKGALLGYMLGKDVEFGSLPDFIQHYENFKKDKKGNPPKVDFRMLDSLGLTDEHWTQIARDAGWTMTRMNLNTFLRHGVFKNAEVTQMIADRLRNPEEIKKAKAFPYQMLSAFVNADDNIPFSVREALQDAMELAVDNVPTFPGQVYVAVDVSGSMGSPITGYRSTSTSKVRCVDVAALFAASVMRKNKSAQVLPFDTSVHSHGLNPRDSVMTNAQKLSKFGGGGTNCSLPIRELNSRKAKGDAIIFVSDNESWVDSGHSYNTPAMMAEWTKFSNLNPKAKLVCIDLTPNVTSQVKSINDRILQVGGFSDAVFDVVNSFLSHGHSSDHWMDVINSVNIDAPLHESAIPGVKNETSEEVE